MTTNKYSSDRKNIPSLYSYSLCLFVSRFFFFFFSFSPLFPVLLSPLPDPSSRTYDPANPSEWNPYSVAMQAAEANRNRNNVSNSSPRRPKDLSKIGVGGSGSAKAGPTSSNNNQPTSGTGRDSDTGNGQPPAEGGEGGGIGAWFRGFGGGAKNGDQNGTSAVENGNGSSGNGGVGGWAARPGWLGGAGGGGGGGGGGSVEGEAGWGEGARGSTGSLVEVQVKVLQEMGFPEVRQERMRVVSARVCVS